MDNERIEKIVNCLRELTDVIMITQDRIFEIEGSLNTHLFALTRHEEEIKCLKESVDALIQEVG